MDNQSKREASQMGCFASKKSLETTSYLKRIHAGKIAYQPLNLLKNGVVTAIAE
jgi:hypothetical protein